EKRPLRLTGISLSGFTDTPAPQLSLFDMDGDGREDKVNDAMHKLQVKYGRHIVKTVGELQAEKRTEE
ncbi:MAG: hypothetical protein FWG38_07420, partial [Defluviitaleaceae bacterium]|nr:hypothetical protein [Defluviitaleaceae bacterium]